MQDDLSHNRRSISIFGATGSIGQSTLSLVRAHPARFHIHLLTAHRNTEALAALVHEFKPDRAIIADACHHAALKSACAGIETKIDAGAAALTASARDPVDLVIGGIVGIAGLRPMQAAIEAGLTIALANKETLVAAGHLIMPSLHRHKARLLPIDSEHNAIFQCMRHEQHKNIQKIILTASGGPFREFTTERMRHVTIEQALAHPNWSMGAKVTIDSATLMNKGLELIEAAWLFDLSSHQLEGLIHPQSAMHALVGFGDGSWLAHLAIADMRVPISYALGYPDRLSWDAPPFDILDIARLDFEAIDTERFPCFGLARSVLGQEPEQAIILNAANEVAVTAFLEQKITFSQIYAHVNEALIAGGFGIKAHDFDSVMALDAEIRQRELHKYTS